MSVCIFSCAKEFIEMIKRNRKVNFFIRIKLFFYEDTVYKIAYNGSGLGVVAAF